MAPGLPKRAQAVQFRPQIIHFALALVTLHEGDRFIAIAVAPKINRPRQLAKLAVQPRFMRRMIQRAGMAVEHLVQLLQCVTYIARAGDRTVAGNPMRP